MKFDLSSFFQNSFSKCSDDELIELFLNRIQEEKQTLRDMASLFNIPYFAMYTYVHRIVEKNQSRQKIESWLL